MKFGVVTPVLDGRARFRACAASVRAAAAALRGGEVVHFVRESAASREPVEDLAAEYGCVYARAPDRGLYDAIAAGLDAACAAGCDALAWLNADEQWLPDAPGHAQRVLESNARIGLVYGDYLLLGPDGSLRAARRELPARRLYLLNGVNYLLSCTVFFRRAVWEGSARFDLSYPRLADKKWYLGVLASGVRAALVGRYYLGAYSMTGENASLGPGAAEEQARLRDEAGALPSPLARRAIRALRVLDKAVHGCYFPDRIDAPLFAPDGSPLRVRGLAGPLWRWPR